MANYGSVSARISAHRTTQFSQMRTWFGPSPGPPTMRWLEMLGLPQNAAHVLSTERPIDRYVWHGCGTSRGVRSGTLHRPEHGAGPARWSIGTQQTLPPHLVTACAGAEGVQKLPIRVLSCGNKSLRTLHAADCSFVAKETWTPPRQRSDLGEAEGHRRLASRAGLPDRVSCTHGVATGAPGGSRRTAIEGCRGGRGRPGCSR
jgi:hypothetical protein